MYVEVKGNDRRALDRALAEFKKKVKKAGILDDLRKYEYHVKPSLKRKKKKLEAIKRQRRENNARVKNQRNRS